MADVVEGEHLARGPWSAIAVELAVSLGVSAVFVWSCTDIQLDPLDRVGQVSLLAAVGLRLVTFVVPMIVALIVAARVRSGVHFELTSRLVCAALAGLASAAIAGGLVMVLHGTPFGLGATIGDSAVLAEWARDVRKGGEAPALYPPLQIHLLVWIAKWLHVQTPYAIKAFQISGVFLVGPAAYASWRLLLRPGWALGIGLVATLPLIDPYRPYPFLVLVVFVPVALRFLQILRRSADWSLAGLLRAGTAIGLLLGVLCLIYSGWLMWSAGGFLVTAAVVFPWRRGRRNGLVLCAVAGVVFAIVTARYFIGVLDTLPVRDGWMYFDSRVEPAYIAMWRGDLPGVVEKLSMWPPAGELAGVGVFSLLLVIGAGIAIALGRGRTVVIGLGSIMTGIWLLRFWHAHRMWETGLVQLYPRTTAELLYCSLLLCGFAVSFVIERARRTASDDSPLRTPSGRIGAICAVMLLLVFSSSAMLDRVMPKEDVRELGNLSWLAWKMPVLDAWNQGPDATVVTSSSYEEHGRSKANLVDRSMVTEFTSASGPLEEREEWIELRFPESRTFSRLVLHASRTGFPVDFTIEVWNGQRWLERVERRGYAPTYGIEIFAWNLVERSDRVRIRATKLTLGEPPLGYVLRFREIGVYE